MKYVKVIWISAAVGLCILLMAGTIGCKEKKINVERAPNTPSKDNLYDQVESLDKSDVISEKTSEMKDYSEQGKDSWYEENISEPNDEPNMLEEEPNDKSIWSDQEPNESIEEPNE